MDSLIGTLLILCALVALGALLVRLVLDVKAGSQ